MDRGSDLLVAVRNQFMGHACAIGIDGVQLIANMPVLITAVAFAVVAGFLSMMPGGLGVRDACFIRTVGAGVRRRKCPRGGRVDAARLAGVGGSGVWYSVYRKR